MQNEMNKYMYKNSWIKKKYKVPSMYGISLELSCLMDSAPNLHTSDEKVDDEFEALTKEQNQVSTDYYSEWGDLW